MTQHTPPAPAGLFDSLFSGPGEMAKRMRAMDWATTSFGPPATWPQSLRTILSVCLASKFPMLIWWGRDLSVLYNDAYIPIFAGKHPWVLGRTGKEAWGEVWDVIGPMFDRVVNNGEATWSNDQLLLLERRGFLEEAYFTWSYSPIGDESGGVGGVFTAVIETTERVLGERRLKTLRELGEQVVSARQVQHAVRSAGETLAKNPFDVPFALVYLLDERGSYASLASASGISAGHEACESQIALDSVSAVWPIPQVVETGQPAMVELAKWQNLPRGLWDQPPTRALVLPINAAGQQRPHGVLVSALSPRLAFDDAYNGFLTLVASHLGTAIASAKAYEEERRRAEALAELDRAKSSFFSNVSHEFRTPLTLLQGPVEDLLRGPDTPPGVRDQLGLVHRNVRRLSKLVNTLLDFSRIEAGRMQPAFEPIDLADHTAAVASIFRAATDRAGLTLHIDCPPLGELVYVDPEMWEKIVLNLVSNAFKFTLDGGIYLSLVRDGDTARLTVRDTGSGIPPDELPRIFERFHRIAGTHGRSQEGSGIGLALVHELVKLHGGRISADSEVGHGTTLTVTVPLGTAHLPPDVPVAAAVRTRIGAASAVFVEEALRWLPDGGASGDAELLDTPVSELSGGIAARADRRRILIAEDNADMRDYLRRLLVSRWDVDVVTNGVEALKQVRKRPPAVVITDVMMPELDGFGVLRALRADEATRHIPVIMLSARAGEEARVGGLEAGADDYLVKPFSSRELVARVETQVIRTRMRVIEEAHRSRLASVFEQAPAAIAILRGPDHVFELANESYLQLVNYRDVVGKPVKEALPEIESQGIIALLDGVYRSGAPHSGRSLPLMVNRTPAGPAELRFFDFVYQPLFDADGRVEGVAAVVYDVTELARAREAAEAANRAKDEFLAMLGHELRNPLAPIVTALQLLRLRGVPAAERERLVIERQVQHLVRLVDDLLDVSRITRGKVQLQRRPVDVADVLAKAIETASPLLEQQRHALSVEMPRGELIVDADVERLAQVLSNLLTNAAKYTEPQGRITVTGTRDGNVAQISVRDTGIGIAAPILPRIFEPFVQEHQALDRARGGLGLGLMIVRSLVELHDGSVAAHSDGPGLGATFTIRLPLSDDRAVMQEQHSASPVPMPAATSMRVLIVDDNADAAIMLGEALAMNGYDVRTAQDGPTALRVAAEWLPAVAILDLGLPVMDGYELARRLRELPGLAAAHLVAVTGYGQDRDRARSKDAGFAAHLVKPVDLTELRALMESFGT